MLSCQHRFGTFRIDTGDLSQVHLEEVLQKAVLISFRGATLATSYLAAAAVMVKTAIFATGAVFFAAVVFFAIARGSSTSSEKKCA